MYFYELCYKSYYGNSNLQMRQTPITVAEHSGLCLTMNGMHITLFNKEGENVVKNIMIMMQRWNLKAPPLNSPTTLIPKFYQSPLDQTKT